MKRIGLLLLLVVLASGSVWAKNKALSLDRDYVAVPDDESLNISGHITMQAWVKFKDLGDMKIISKRPGDQLFSYCKK